MKAILFVIIILQIITIVLLAWILDALLIIGEFLSRKLR